MDTQWGNGRDDLGDWDDIYALLCVKQVTRENPLQLIELTQCSVVTRREHTCVYGWFTSPYGRNQHNLVKQLHSNYKKADGRLETDVLNLPQIYRVGGRAVRALSLPIKKGSW